MIDYLKHLAAFSQMRKPSGFNYGGTEDYILDRGVDQTLSEPLTDEELDTLYFVLNSSGRFMQKQCFYNAQMVVLYHPEFRYVEGYAQGRAIIPVHHAWLTLNGKLIDLTWRTDKSNHKGRLRDRIFGAIPEGWQYRGIPFDAEQIRKRIGESGEARAVIGDWQRGHPLFKQERLHPPEQFDERIVKIMTAGDPV
jgi:hypothetical protein